MPAQIRPTRLEVSDRFPMLGFSIRSDGPPVRAEVVLASEPDLFGVEGKARRTAANFYSTRAAGALRVARGEAVFLVPPEVIARFVGQDRLYFGLATAREGDDGAMQVVVKPTAASPYISLKGLTGRSMQRVRVLPNRQQRAAGYGNGGQAALEWAGDVATPGMEPVGTKGSSATAPLPNATTRTNGATPTAHGQTPYDDGFGPMPPKAATPISTTALPPAPAQALDAAPLTVAGQQQPVTAPAVRRLSTFEKSLIKAGLGVFSGPLAPLLLGLPAAARAAGVSIGIGPTVGGGLGAGGTLGAGLIFGPDDELGVYGSAEVDIGFITSISGAVQITVVRGGIDSFNGWTMALAISGGEGIVGGAAALFDANANFQGVSVSVGIGAGFSPIDFYVAAQRGVATQLGVAVALGRMPVHGLADEIPLDPGIGGMSIGPDALAVGDIILSTTNAAASGLIRFGTAGQVSHAMLYVGQGEQVIEAIAGGIVMRSLAEAIGEATTAVAFRVPGLTAEQALIASDKAGQFIGRSYDYVGVVRQAAFQVDQRLCSLLPDDAAARCRKFAGQIDLGAGSNERFYCSSMVLEALGAAGVSLTNEPPSWSSPNDLANLSIGSGKLAYIGHLKASRPSLGGFFGQIVGTTQSFARSRAMSEESFTINWDDVQLVPQPTDKSCWAAAAAMVIGWRDQMSLSPEVIGEICNRSTKSGLYSRDNEAFAAEMGLVAEPPQSYSIDGFRRLLASSGPLWVSKGTSPNLHAIVITGLYSDGSATYVRVTDPWDRTVGSPGSPGQYQSTHVTGSRYIMTWDDFVAEYEAAISGSPNVNLQILHSGTANGRTANIGGAIPIGYAQSAGDAFTINWDEVESIAQPTGLSCWATAASMVIGWRDRMSLTPETVAGICNRPIDQALQTVDFQAFAREMGLSYEYPVCYTVDGLRTLLANKGPLWVFALVPSGHAIVVTGLYSDGTNAFVRVTDPWDRTVGAPGAPGIYLPTHATGSRYIMTWDAFIAEYEAGSAASLQILHAGGTAGRTPNIGPTTPVGYAMSSHAKSRRTGRALDADQPRTIGSDGGVEWDLMQYPGMKSAASMVAATVAINGDTITLADWPYLDEPDGNRSQAALAIDWKYDASGSVGAIRIAPTRVKATSGRTLKVTATVEDADSTPACAALQISIRYAFRHPSEGEHVASTTIAVFGNGKHTRIGDWLPAAVVAA